METNQATPNQATTNQATPNQATPNQATTNQATPNQATTNQATPNQATPNHQTFQVPESLSKLTELAYNLWFSWNEDAQSLFARIDQKTWQSSDHNPVMVLAAASSARWNELLHHHAFMNKYQEVIMKWDNYQKRKSWFSLQYPQFKGVIAYFSAEFGFHESLPIYSGGLGVLAGDHVKSASDLGVPLIGVGLLYKKGYFKQHINQDGDQQAELVDHDFSLLPVAPVRINGKPLTIMLPLPGRHLKVNIWHVQVGRNVVYLLDSNHPDNSSDDQELTGQLYGGNQDIRIQQEILLGVGGIQLLRVLGLYPKVYHINEGHAAFISLERLREYIHQGVSFGQAMELIRASTVFTTHTPVPAGHDVFALSMFEHYLEPLLSQMVYEREQIIELGLDPAHGVFNMTHLAMNSAARRNGVSRLHGSVSRQMFHVFHGDMLVDEVPIDSITNGVHMDTWVAPEWKELLDQWFIAGWRYQSTKPNVWDSLTPVPNPILWKIHLHLKQKIIEFARSNLKAQRRKNGESEERIAEVTNYLDVNVLTVGFARRYATYKRATLIFSDLDRLNRVVNHPRHPVQFIFAGKAHPADHAGQELIREIYNVSQMDEFRGKIVILENYNMELARLMVQGVDVWLNNPKRAFEASGTSGQKAAMNGVINFSVLDGWWDEGYNGLNGWAIESNHQAAEDVQQQENTESLYTKLEREIVPLYYSGGPHPEKWVHLMKRSIQSIAPSFHSDRMVMDYTNRCYLPAAENYAHYSRNDHEQAIRIADFKSFIKEQWPQIKVESVRDKQEEQENMNAQADDPQRVNQNKQIEARVHLGKVGYQYAVVEAIYHEEREGKWFPIVVPLHYQSEEGKDTHLFSGFLPSHLLYGPHYYLRVRPMHREMSGMFEISTMIRT